MACSKRYIERIQGQMIGETESTLGLRTAFAAAWLRKTIMRYVVRTLCDGTIQLRSLIIMFKVYFDANGSSQM